MPDSFDGIRLKRQRAWDEIHALKADMEAFLDRQNPRPHDVLIDFDKDTKTLTVRLKINSKPDPMWGVRIGEILHNLRSSLDHLAHELYVLSNRKQRPPKDTKIQFPIYWDAKGFDKRGREQYLKNIRSNAVALIRAEQPFPITDGGTGEQALSPLWHLKELNERDKHRTLHLMGTLVEQFQFTFAPAVYGGNVEREVRDPGPIEDNAILVRARFPNAPGWPFANKKVNCQLRVHIAFDKWTPAVGGWLVSGTLIDIANRADRILKKIGTDIFKLEL